MTLSHESWEKSDATALFEEAAANQGFTSFKEFAAVSAMTSSESVQSAAADSMDDSASAPLVPKPEFKVQFEAWQRSRSASCNSKIGVVVSANEGAPQKTENKTR